MKKSYKEIIKATAVLSIICLVISAALAGTNKLTKDKIAELNVKAKNDAMQRIIAADDYKTATTELDGAEYEYNIASNASGILGFIFTTEANGYGGAVSVMTGIDGSGKIIAVEVLDVSSETVGLGQNASKDDFKSQFAGKSGTLEVSKNATGDQIQALTGATITSTAVTKAVNTALALYETISDGVKGE